TTMLELRRLQKSLSRTSSSGTMVYKVSSKADFEAQLEAAGDKLVVVDFYATWCPPCHFISPKVEQLATKLKDEVIFLKVDVDESELLAAEYGIEAMPTFVYIK